MKDRSAVWLSLVAVLAVSVFSLAVMVALVVTRGLALDARVLVDSLALIGAMALGFALGDGEVRWRQSPPRTRAIAAALILGLSALALCSGWAAFVGRGRSPSDGLFSAGFVALVALFAVLPTGSGPPRRTAHGNRR